MEDELKNALDKIDAYIDIGYEDVQKALDMVRNEIYEYEKLLRYYRGELADNNRVKEVLE